jgi:hypothetical protein
MELVVSLSDKHQLDLEAAELEKQHLLSASERLREYMDG